MSWPVTDKAAGGREGDEVRLGEMEGAGVTGLIVCTLVPPPGTSAGERAAI